MCASGASTGTSLQELFDLLGGLPPAIIQAVAHICEEETTVREFIGLYHDVETHGALFQEAALTIDLEQKSVLYAWELSYRKIAGPNYPSSKSNSAMLLDLLGFLDAQRKRSTVMAEAESYFDHEDIIEGLR